MKLNTHISSDILEEIDELCAAHGGIDQMTEAAIHELGPPARTLNLNLLECLILLGLDRAAANRP